MPSGKETIKENNKTLNAKKKLEALKQQQLLEALTIQQHADAPDYDVIHSAADNQTADDIIDDYMTFMGDLKQKPDNRPEPKDGRTKLTFPSMEAAGQFFSQQAEKNRAFIVVDKDNNVIAYSNGNGQLYHGDGNPYQPGEAFKPSNVQLADFTMPANTKAEPEQDDPGIAPQSR